MQWAFVQIYIKAHLQRVYMRLCAYTNLVTLVYSFFVHYLFIVMQYISTGSNVYVGPSI